MKVEDAVRVLSKEYEGRIEVRFGTAMSEEGQEAVKRNGWEKAKHGLECVAPDGTVTGHLPGHNYGRDEILEKIEELLAATEVEAPDAE